MNENVNLVKILENCPKGWELYSPLFGTVIFSRIFRNSLDYGLLTVEVIDNKKKYWYFYAEDGRFVCLNKKYNDYDEDRVGDSFILSKECLLFPSKDQRDWSKFTAPWYKREKFDPKTLQPFDKVLVSVGGEWQCDLFSHILSGDIFNKRCIGVGDMNVVIPYNEETKHLIGTKEEVPDYYKYWINNN